MNYEIQHELIETMSLDASKYLPADGRLEEQQMHQIEPHVRKLLQDKEKSVFYQHQAYERRIIALHRIHFA